MNTRRIIRNVAIALALLVAAGGAMAIAILTERHGTFSQRRIGLPATPIGGPFELTSHRGALVRDTDFAGKVKLVFFGFTSCPDVCPTALTLISGLLDQLGADADRVQPILITVDPERDSPERLAEYAAAFHPSLVALTGSPEEIAAVARAYGIFFKKVERDDGDYSVDHSASIYVIDAAGAFRGTLDIHENPETALAKLRRAVGIGSDQPSS